MKNISFKAMSALLTAGLFLSLQPAYGWSTSTIKWLGKGKFGAGFGGDLTVNAGVKNAKFAAGVRPFMKGKVFNKPFPLLVMDGRIGNYGNTDWNAMERDQRFDKEQVKKIKHCVTIRAFGKGVAFTCNPVKLARNTFKKNMVLLNWRKYSRKKIITVPVPAGPITIQVSAGLFGSIEYRPTLSFYGYTGVSLTSAPRAAVGLWVEGAKSLVLLKGGLGADLSIFDGQGGVRAVFEPWPGVAGLYLVAKVRVLKGRVYAFVDRLSVKCCFKRRWNRIVNLTIFNWHGFQVYQNYDPIKEWDLLPNSIGGFPLNWVPEMIKKMDLRKYRAIWKQRHATAQQYREMYDYNDLVDWIKKQL